MKVDRPAITLYLELVEGYKEPCSWEQAGALWHLPDVTWPSVPSEGDSVEIGGDESEGGGVIETVRRVFWHDNGRVSVEFGRVYTRDDPLPEFEKMLTAHGWVKT